MGKNDPGDSSGQPGVPPAGASGSFWQAKTIAELAAEQAVAIPQDLDALLGAGKDLWADDAELEAFLADLEAIRGEER